MKPFYVQVIDPVGAECSDGTKVSINRRFYFEDKSQDHMDMVAGRFGKDLVLTILKAPVGEFTHENLTIIKE